MRRSFVIDLRLRHENRSKGAFFLPLSVSNNENA